jgi:hypothetical protein
MCAMLGATLTSMDAGLNKGAGVFVRSLYKPLMNPQCSEKQLLVVSKITTLVFGAIIVAIAVIFSRYRTMGLFDTTNLVAACLFGPMLVPLLFGMFFKRTPSWSALSTTVLGFAVSLSVYTWFNDVSQHHAEVLQHAFGMSRPLNSDETTFLQLAVMAFSTVIPCTVWFFLSSRWFDSDSIENRQRVEELFRRMATPVDVHGEGVQNLDHAVYTLLGGLCLAFGAFILLLVGIPNSLGGRLCFVFCGGTILIAGLLLRYASGRLVPAAVHADALVEDDALALESPEPVG